MKLSIHSFVYSFISNVYIIISSCRELLGVFHYSLFHLCAWYPELFHPPWSALHVMSSAINHSIQQSRVGHPGLFYGSISNGEQTVPAGRKRNRQKRWRKWARRRTKTWPNIKIHYMCNEVWKIPQVLSTLFLKEDDFISVITVYINSEESARKWD